MLKEGKYGYITLINGILGIMEGIMKKYDKLLKMYFFDRLQEEELDLLKEYFYDEESGRYNEVSNKYIFGKKFDKLVNKEIVKPYIQRKYMGNRPKMLYLLDREIKNKLNSM